MMGAGILVLAVGVHDSELLGDPIDVVPVLHGPVTHLPSIESPRRPLLREGGLEGRRLLARPIQAGAKFGASGNGKEGFAHA